MRALFMHQLGHPLLPWWWTYSPWWLDMYDWSTMRQRTMTHGGFAHL